MLYLILLLKNIFFISIFLVLTIYFIIFQTNVHVNNSNIREIPLVDNLPAVKKPVTVNKTVPIVEEEVSFAILYLFI